MSKKNNRFANDITKIAFIFSLISLALFGLIPYLQSFLINYVSDDLEISHRSLDVVKTIPIAFLYYAIILLTAYAVYTLFQNNFSLQKRLDKIYNQIEDPDKFKLFKQNNLLWLTIIISLILFTTFSSYINHMFVNDDYAFIIRAARFSSLSELPQLILHKGKFFQSMDPHRLWPMIDIFFLAARFILGKNPGNYHIASIILHTLNCLLVYLVAFELLKNKYIAFWSAIIFATRAAFVQPIYFTALQTTRQMSFFFILSFYLYIKKDSIAFRLLSLTAFILALACKEPPIIIPALIFLYEITINLDSRLNFKKILEVFKKIWLYIIISCAYLIFNLTRITSSSTEQQGTYAMGFGLNVIRGLLKYLTIPFNSNYDPLLLLIILSAILLFRKKLLITDKTQTNVNLKKIFVFSAGWFFMSLLPYLFLKAWTQEYFVYIPLVVGSVFLAALLYVFKVSISKKSPALAAIFSVIFFVGIITAFSFEFKSDHITTRWFIISGNILKQCSQDVKKIYPKLPKGAKVYIVQGDSAQELYNFWSFTQAGQFFNWIYDDYDLKPILLYNEDKEKLAALNKDTAYAFLYKGQRLHPYFKADL